MTEQSKRGGKRNPPGGRPPKPPGEKYKGLYLKLPQHQLEWLRQHREKANEAVNAFIVDLIEKAMQDEKK